MLLLLLEQSEVYPWSKIKPACYSSQKQNLPDHVLNKSSKLLNSKQFTFTGPRKTYKNWMHTKCLGVNLKFLCQGAKGIYTVSKSVSASPRVMHPTKHQHMTNGEILFGRSLRSRAGGLFPTARSYVWQVRRRRRCCIAALNVNFTSFDSTVSILTKS